MQIGVQSGDSQMSVDATANISEPKGQNCKERYNVTVTKQYYSENQVDLKSEKNKKILEKLDNFLQKEKSHVEYEIHKGFGDIMIKIVDNETKKVIKEIPSKKILDMMEKLCELSGVMLDKKA